MSQLTGVHRPRDQRRPGPDGPARPAGAPGRRGHEPGPAVDPARWPDVARVPRAAGRAAVARLLFTTVAARLGIRVQLPGGRVLASPAAGPPATGTPGTGTPATGTPVTGTPGTGTPAMGTPATGTPGTGTPAGRTPTMYLWRPADFFRRVGAAGLIGFGESYMAGDWDSDDLPGLLTSMAEHMDRLVPRWLQWLRAAYVARPPADWDADPEGARRNVRQHYDLSNDMFALFLDETMTYSAALFEREPGRLRPAPATVAPADTLAAAQRRKIDRILDIAGVGPGCRVLEIGTGWGELAIRAAGRGARVLSITVSAEQRALARRRIAAAGLADRVAVELRDYREVTGQFDAIVSVEMVEAVAERYWPEYFATLDRLLAPGGRIGLQSITMAHDRMMATRRTQTWILKYIFPGGLIPSVTAIEQNLRAHTTLEITGRRDFGQHYARTLQIWRDRFGAAAGDLDWLGFDGVFRRMWELYLAYSEAGFRSGYLQVSQFLLTRAVTAADPRAAWLCDPGPETGVAA
ncbi:MAG TPA: class I SAM-dependent methyltransferase [Streptosporangiaceae bacterium]